MSLLVKIILAVAVLGVAALAGLIPPVLQRGLAAGVRADAGRRAGRVRRCRRQRHLDRRRRVPGRLPRAGEARRPAGAEPIDAARNGEPLELVGAITFPIADLGITPPSIGGFVTVEPDATLELRILLEEERS